jgi:VanZ family protein
VNHRFDIFQIDATGDVRWHDSAPSFEDARARVKELAAQFLSKYLVLNQETGSKVVLNPDGVEEKRSEMSA